LGTISLGVLATVEKVDRIPVEKCLKPKELETIVGA
jgi:hypothetical protein